MASSALTAPTALCQTANECKTCQREQRRATFETAMHLYVRFYLRHMQIEETEVLPLAEAVLSADDWAELDAAFLKNRDPLAGFEADVAYQPLFRRILAALPSDSSVGAALQALAGAGPPKFESPR